MCRSAAFRWHLISVSVPPPIRVPCACRGVEITVYIRRAVSARRNGRVCVYLFISPQALPRFNRATHLGAQPSGPAGLGVLLVYSGCNKYSGVCTYTYNGLRFGHYCCSKFLNCWADSCMYVAVSPHFCGRRLCACVFVFQTGCWPLHCGEEHVGYPSERAGPEGEPHHRLFLRQVCERLLTSWRSNHRICVCCYCSLILSIVLSGPVSRSVALSVDMCR